MDTQFVAILSLIIVFLAIFLAIFTLLKARRSGISLSDQSFIKSQWKNIEFENRNGQKSSAILNADKLLGHVLSLLGYDGSVGNKLKSLSKSSLLTKEELNKAWRAHKIRNKVAHEIGIKISNKLARKTLNNFKSIIKILGVKF